MVSGQATQIGVLGSTYGGGWDGSQAPMGGTFVVGANGDVYVGDGYGSTGIFQITPDGTQTVLASGLDSSTAALDSYGNLYVAGYYDANVYKIPYDPTTGTYSGWTTAPTSDCLGGNQDTSACIFAPAVSTLMASLAGSGSSGYADIAFDSQGNFFFATSTLPGTNPNAIYECDLSCISSSTATPILIYADTNPMGAMAIDPWGNIFFVDGANNGASSGTLSYLNEIPLSSGTYASSPTVVETYTTTAGYNGLSGLAIAGNGTVYFGTNSDGVFAFSNTQAGGPDSSAVYMVSTIGGKAMALDAKGNIYQMPYNGTLGSDVISFIPVNNFTLGSEPIGTAASAVSATIFDSSASCTPTIAANAMQFGVASTDFTATAGTTCSAAFGGSNGTFGSAPLSAAAFSAFSVTLNFTPTAAGTRSAALDVADSANSSSGMAALTGVGQGALPNLDPGVMTAYSTGFTAPASVIADPAGDLFVADSSAGAVYEIAQGTTTPVAIGSGFSSPTALAFDAYGNLFIADDGVPAVEEIANTSTSGGFTAGTQTTVVSSTFLFGGTALSDATGLAVGPAGTLYISDPGNQRVVSYNPANGQGAVTNATAGNGLAKPMGLAVDSSGNLYVADSSANKVFIFSSAGGFTSITPPGVGQVSGVSVDASGSVLVSDATSGAIVRIPNLSGTLTTAKADTIETFSPQASSVWLDSLGNMYVANSSGQSVYAIQRTAGAIDLGTVQDGLTNSGTVFLENAGNEDATLATPAVTQPANSMLTLTASATSGCTDGSTGPAGSSCQFTATFAPLVGTADGVQTGTATVNISSPATSLTVNLSGTATQSSVLAQTITNFNPPPTMLVGQQTTLSATGGGSGNPVVFTIDASSSCPTCASISGNILTALDVGTVIVDANQAGGTNGGKQYAAAQQVQATIAISSATVASVPALIMSQIHWLSPLTGGGFTAGANLAGGSFAVNQQGNVISGNQYGNAVLMINGQTGALTTLANISNPGGVTVDSHNNLYISHDYNSIILKVPFVNGSYVPFTDSTTAPACTGNDTQLCTFANFGANIKALAFDAAGNFYGVSTPSSTGASTIYECDTSCQPAGTGTAIYSDANAVSQIAFDPWGNLFFTDGVYADSTAVSSLQSSSSNLYELPYTAGTGFASTPVLLQTYTDPSPSAYDNQLDGVAVGADGTVYYATQNEGVFAMPNTQSGGPDTAHQYAVGITGAKGMELDSNGNVWVAVYSTAINTSGADTIGVEPIGDLTVPIAQLNGAPVTAPAVVVDNAFDCSSPATLAFTSTDSQFSATAGASCTTVTSNFSTPVSAGSYSATITFAATAGGPQSTTLNISDTTNGGTGTATVSGVGQETPQTLTYTAPTTTTYTYTPGLTITVSVTNGGSNNPAVFTVDSSSTGAGTFSSTTVTGTTSTATLTVTQAGTIVIDANEVGGLVNGIYYDNATQAQLTLTINQAVQTIVFPQPNSPVTYAASPNNTTVQLSANGGDSGNPVVFTVDPSSAGAGTISTSTVSGGTSTATLTVTQAGNIVVDANQAGDANYADATQVQQTVVVNQASQTITFIPLSQPFHYIAGGVTLTIQATGGGSNNPIVFAVDSSSTMTGSFSTSTVSGSTSTAVLTIPAQTASSGTIVIDATQPGDVNYTDAPQAQETIDVLAPLPTQTITFDNPGTQVVDTPLKLTATASSGFPVDYSASPSSVCTVSGSTATFVAAGNCTIVASQPGDNIYFAAAPSVTQTFTVNPKGQIPAMNLDLSLSSVTIQKGTVGLTQLTVTSVNNFTGNVTFSCSGQSSSYSCAFNPTTVMVGENASGTSALTITPGSTTAAVRHNFKPLFPVTFAFALCFFGIKKRYRLHLLLLLLVTLTGFGLLIGCGGTSSSVKTQTTTSSITVTATSGSMTASKTLQVIVQQ